MLLLNNLNNYFRILFPSLFSYEVKSNKSTIIAGPNDFQYPCMPKISLTKNTISSRILKQIIVFGQRVIIPTWRTLFGSIFY